MAKLATKMPVWLLRVCVRSLSGPSQTILEILRFKMSSACSNLRRAVENWVAKSLAIPGYWAPWPGNKKTIF